MRIVSMVLSLLLALPLLAQTASDERDVIGAAVAHHTQVSLMYVGSWLLSPRTEELSLTDSRPDWTESAAGDFERRNAEGRSLQGLHLPENVHLGDLQDWGTKASFDVKGFSERYQDTKAIWVSRPGFSDADHAIIRLDVAQDRLPYGAVLSLERVDGSWVVTHGRSVRTRPYAN